MLDPVLCYRSQKLHQVDLSGREEVYSLMGYSVFSSKAFIFYKKCQICYLSGKVALKDKNSDRSGNNLNSKFTRGFLALTINLTARHWQRAALYILRRPQNFEKSRPYFCLQYIQK